MSRPEPSADRQPHAVRPRRMDALATLPLFFRLAGRRVVVIGGNESAAWKAELLSAAGATVEVRAVEPCADLAALAADPPGGPVILQRRSWSAADLEGAAAVVAAAEDDGEAVRIFDAARAANTPVNVIDRPDFCTFLFGAVVNRSPLVVGISTDGAAPVFGQAIRSRIEALLPAGFSRWAAAAKAWRGEIAGLRLGSMVRRRFWEGFAAAALRAPDRAPAAADRERLLRVARDAQACPAHGGHVTLVGAGPGDPELLTLKAVRALRCADVILFDDLVAPEILDYARREARRMLVGKTGYAPSCKQDDINALMVGLAKSGKRVVRLKSGDPLLFGRAGEEIAALERAGVPLDIVPGITAAQGAAAGLKVSLTERQSTRRVQFIAGHARDGRLPDDIDMAALADPLATTAVYMPLGTLGELMRRLVACGVEPSRPVSAVCNATRPDERVIHATVATIEPMARLHDVGGPCVVLIGSVLRSRQPMGAVAAGPRTA